jgi:hypothetical protein
VTDEAETLTYELFGTASRELAQQVADDVADTGKTLEPVRDFCSGYVAAVRTAVVHEKAAAVGSPPPPPSLGPLR